MTNPSTIWAQLSLPNPASGSLPFVANDNQTIVTDVSNFNYDPVGLQLFIQNGLNVGYSTVATPGVSVTCNTASGRITVPAGNASFTLNNLLITANSIVLVHMETNDATSFNIRTIIPSLGKVVVTLNAASTGPIVFSYLVFN
jgi:hypothetical protein